MISKSIGSVFLSIVFLPTVNAFAQGATHAGSEAKSAALAPPASVADDCQAFMPVGPFKGQRIDLSSRRSAEIVSNGEGEVVVKNYEREGKRWILTLDPSCVESSDWLEEDFKVTKKFLKKLPVLGSFVPDNLKGLMGHSMMRYNLREGCKARLKPQDPKDSALGERLVSDLVFSIDGVGVEGFKGVDPIKGLFQNYALAHRMTSSDQKEALAVGKLKREIIPIPLALTPGEASHLFMKQLMEADAYGKRLCHQDPNRDNSDLMYHTRERNCTSEIYRILFKAFPEKFRDQQKKNEAIARSGNMRPLDAEDILKDLKLVDEAKLKRTPHWTIKNRPSFHVDVLK